MVSVCGVFRRSCVRSTPSSILHPCYTVQILLGHTEGGVFQFRVERCKILQAPESGRAVRIADTGLGAETVRTEIREAPVMNTVRGNIIECHIVRAGGRRDREFTAFPYIIFGTGNNFYRYQYCHQKDYDYC